MAATLQLLERLDRTFEGGGEGAVARKLLSFLVKHPATTHITLQLVRQIALERFERRDGAAGNLRNQAGPNLETDAVAVRMLQYLSAGADGVLEAKFELIEEDREDLAPYVLTDEEVRAVVAAGINPISGEYDPDIKRKVVIFFAPTHEMAHLLAAYAADGGVL